MYPTSVALACLARSACINAAMTARGMQQIGMAFVLEPGLRHLYPEPQARAEAFARYAAHSHTHPLMAPLFVGILLSLEEAVARGALPATSVSAVRETLATTLSALGDAFFSGSLLPFWALACINLLLCGCTGLAAALTAALCAAQLLFRVWAFFYGLRRGMAALARLRQLNIINWAARLKMVNAVLTALVLRNLPAGRAQSFPWAGYALGTLALLAAAWLTGRLRLPRMPLWCAALGALILVDLVLAGM
ncbi:PTS system mannose/fructose/sorbose family transporter subunit IID [uncultured Desulfovibrio sp.]|uniref:PTS system mannose/fructose/sorbose family transporter subunit IID n=1 Tax=uncultured Desulfovibrio sp. TaxID=167968 RepID=UPI00260C531D|nr:PTS system mannose/fructose/sorbose family transporter subunit IID [uncultured Desulfovibrio sp.]